MLISLVVGLRADPIHAAAGDEQWSAGWGRSGANNTVESVASFGSDIVIGGEFATAGDAIATRVARWDGAAWHAMGEGFNDRVFALVEWNGSLYAAGDFTASGATPVGYIARWDGATWVDVGGGVDGPVTSMAIYGGNLVAGGLFGSAGSTNAGGVAIWNGTTWSDPGAEIGSFGDGRVEALAVFGSDLIVAGRFEEVAFGTFARNIARYDGSTWSGLGAGVSYFEDEQEDGEVYDLTVHAGELIVAGFFLTAGGVASDGVARWNGTSWSALAGTTFFDNQVYAVESYGGSVYASGGQFGGMERWDGTQWIFVSFNSNNAWDMAVIGSSLVVGGDISRSDFSLSPNGSSAVNIASYDGSSWSNVGQGWGASNDVQAFVEWDGQLVAGGKFGRIGNLRTERIAAWDGTAWSPLAANVSGSSNRAITSLSVWNGDLIAGGIFSEIDGVTAEKIARFDGAQWHALGAGSPLSSVGAMVTIGADLYAIGAFNGGGTGVGSWDGTAWTNLGGAPTGNFSILKDLVAYGGMPVLAGGFTALDGIPANNIARWDGANWQPLGAGLDGIVEGLEVFGGNLYATGTFTTAGGVAAARIAMWDGTSWSALGTGLDNRGVDLQMIGSDLVVTGHFLNAGGNPASHIARWDGTAWSNLGSGLDDRAEVLGIYDGSIFVGGEFATAGAGAGAHIARWTPVPEASFALMLGLGSAALSWRTPRPSRPRA